VRAVGTLAPGQERCVPCQMAQEVEWISVRLLAGGGQFLETDPALGEFAKNLGAGVGIGPRCLQRIAGRVHRSHGPTGILRVAHDLQFLAVGVEVVDQVTDHFDLAAIDVELAWFVGLIGHDLGCARLGVDRVFAFRLLDARSGLNDRFDDITRFIDRGLLDQ
jgi:hypothetical protein